MLIQNAKSIINDMLEKKSTIIKEKKNTYGEIFWLLPISTKREILRNDAQQRIAQGTRTIISNLCTLK